MPAERTRVEPSRHGKGELQATPSACDFVRQGGALQAAAPADADLRASQELDREGLLPAVARSLRGEGASLG